MDVEEVENRKSLYQRFLDEGVEEGAIAAIKQYVAYERRAIGARDGVRPRHRKGDHAGSRVRAGGRELYIDAVQQFRTAREGQR